jgi:hypothetical protein
MSQLHTLSTSLNFSQSESFDPSAAADCKTNIDYLSLGASSSYRLRFLGPEETEALEKLFCSLAPRLAEALISWTPKVRDLRLSLPFHPSSMVSYIQSLPNLVTLSSANLDTQDQLLIECELPALESLHLSGEHCDFTLNALFCPTAANLSIQDFADVQNSQLLSPLRLFPNKWDKLRSLDVSSDDANWENISFPLVDRITIGSNSYSFPIHLSPSLLRELACKPNVFPSLKSLGMRKYPEWDVLFIMLEKRNFPTSKEAAAITEIKLPAFPGPMILQPLIDRLKKRMSVRPSNFSISLQSLFDGYADTNV